MFIKSKYANFNQWEFAFLYCIFFFKYWSKVHFILLNFPNDFFQFIFLENQIVSNHSQVWISDEILSNPYRLNYNIIINLTDLLLKTMMLLLKYCKWKHLSTFHNLKQVISVFHYSFFYSSFSAFSSGSDDWPTDESSVTISTLLRQGLIYSIYFKRYVLSYNCKQLDF